MKIEFRSSFARDLKNIKDKALLTRLREAIENVEQAGTSQDLTNLMKLQGPGNYYRIRVGDYRLGLIIEDEVVIFVRCLNRSDIYKYFP